MNRRPLHDQIQAQHHACRILEHAEDAAWRRLKPYADSLRDRPRTVRPEVTERLLARLDAWRALSDVALQARERLHRLIAIAECDRQAELEAQGVTSLFSWGVPGSQRERSPAASAPPSTDSPEISPVPPASLPGGNPAPTPDGYTGTPQPPRRTCEYDTARGPSSLPCSARAPQDACQYLHPCDLPWGHEGPHRSRKYGCEWPATAGAMAVA